MLKTRNDLMSDDSSKFFLEIAIKPQNFKLLLCLVTWREVLFNLVSKLLRNKSLNFQDTHKKCHVFPLGFSF